MTPGMVCRYQGSPPADASSARLGGVTDTAPGQQLEPARRSQQDEDLINRQAGFINSSVIRRSSMLPVADCVQASVRSGFPGAPVVNLPSRGVFFSIMPTLHQPQTL